MLTAATLYIRTIGPDSKHFHLIAPYEKDPRKWLGMEWIDQYTGNCYRITTEGSHGDRRTALVKTYGDVILEYEFHAESKCADAEGNPSDISRRSDCSNEGMYTLASSGLSAKNRTALKKLMRA
jgi:hypothetical protein